QVLTALQILGRGNCFQDTSQLSLMSEAPACTCFHIFCKRFVEELYDEHIHLPTGAAHEKVMGEYDKVGFTGAIGSTDVTHVKWDCFPFSLQRSYTGEEGYPTIAYQATVDHTGNVLSVTRGFPGAQNDKTIIRYDAAVQRVREDTRYKNKTRQYSTSRYSPTTLLLAPEWVPFARLLNGGEKKLEMQFSKHLESVRKDVECFFGILRGRFRILKLPILFRSRERIDNAFFTCCILHNML
ncbi:unnamed protein product, partial [Ascophyllum nodosum]